MKAMLIPTGGLPREIDLQPDADGSTLHPLQQLVGGNIEPFDVIFGAEVCVYVNEEGIYSCPPNRAVYATETMEEAEYISQMDYRHPVEEGELYTILFGDLVAVGFDPMSGQDRDLSAAETEEDADYFTRVSAPGSGMREAIAIQNGSHRREGQTADRTVTLKDEAAASREASQALSGSEHDGSDRNAR